jgi:lipopolysaccharide biosynthesis regulator YciM
MFKKTLFIVAAIFSLTAVAADKTSVYKETIKKAEDFLLQKERSKAVKLLTSLLDQEKQNKQAQSEARKILKDINGLFLNEKAQQNYELALNLKNTDSNQALAKLNEALAWESDNFKILTEISRIKINKKDCKSTLQALELANQQNPFDELISLTLSQAYFCESETVKCENIVNKFIDPKRKTNKYEWLQLEFLLKIKEKDYTKAKDIFAEMKTVEQKNPQLELYESLLNKNNSTKNENTNKNALTCKGVSQSLLRKFQQDPFFCELELLSALTESKP